MFTLILNYIDGQINAHVLKFQLLIATRSKKIKIYRHLNFKFIYYRFYGL